MYNAPGHVTLYGNIAVAHAIADANNENDEDGWTYTVTPRGDKVAVEVRDDEGFVVGYL